MDIAEERYPELFYDDQETKKYLKIQILLTISTEITRSTEIYISVYILVPPHYVVFALVWKKFGHNEGYKGCSTLSIFK